MQEAGASTNNITFTLLIKHLQTLCKVTPLHVTETKAGTMQVTYLASLMDQLQLLPMRLSMVMKLPHFSG